jgi:hypothetical protein
VLSLRAFNLETMLVGEHIKSKESIITQIRCVTPTDSAAVLLSCRVLVAPPCPLHGACRVMMSAAPTF